VPAAKCSVPSASAPATNLNVTYTYVYLCPMCYAPPISCTSILAHVLLSVVCYHVLMMTRRSGGEKRRESTGYCLFISSLRIVTSDFLMTLSSLFCF
jgi:hypothetical protein